MPLPRTVRLAASVLLVAACAPGRRSTPTAAPGPAPSPIVRADQTSGTRALLIAVSPVNDRVVWVSGASGTWVRTVDGGTTWQTGRVAGAETLQFRDVHAVDANIAYLLSIGAGPQSRIYRTGDAGAHWTLQFTNADPKGFLDCFDFWDAKRGIAIGDAVDGHVYLLATNDGGAHWDRIPPSSLPAAQPNEGSFAASGTCLVTGPGGSAWAVASNADHGRLLRTADYGRTWRVDTLPISTHDGSGPQSVGFRDARHGIVLGGGANSKPTDTLAAITADGGKTWSARTHPPLVQGIWGGVWVPGAHRPTVVAVGPSGAVYSSDEGATWVAIDKSNYWSVGFASPRAGWAVGTMGRITRLSGF